jgi:hypothetical protein
VWVLQGREEEVRDSREEKGLRYPRQGLPPEGGSHQGIVSLLLPCLQLKNLGNTMRYIEVETCIVVCPFSCSSLAKNRPELKPSPLLGSRRVHGGYIHVMPTVTIFNLRPLLFFG